MRSHISPCLAVLIVLVLGFPAIGAESHPVEISNLMFVPENVSVHPGDTVVWTNKDDRDHTVVAQDGSFASTVIHHGESFSHKFEKPGTFTYGCKLHPRMKGVVTVVAK
jgi:plastocyanin